MRESEAVEWLRLSPRHQAAFRRALDSAGLAVPESEPTADPHAVREIVDAVASALSDHGFDRDGEPTPEGQVLEDLVDYFVPHHPDYGDTAG